MFRNDGLGKIYTDTTLAPNWKHRKDYVYLPDTRPETRRKAAQKGGETNRAKTVKVTLPEPPWTKERKR